MSSPSFPFRQDFTGFEPVRPSCVPSFLLGFWLPASLRNQRRILPGCVGEPFFGTGRQKHSGRFDLPFSCVQGCIRRWGRDLFQTGVFDCRIPRPVPWRPLVGRLYGGRRSASDCPRCVKPRPIQPSPMQMGRNELETTGVFACQMEDARRKSSCKPACAYARLGTDETTLCHRLFADSSEAQYASGFRPHLPWRRRDVRPRPGQGWTLGRASPSTAFSSRKRLLGPSVANTAFFVRNLYGRLGFYLRNMP